MPTIIDEYKLIAKVCRASYFEFLKEFWYCFCPEKPVWNWHIALLCNEIQIVCERVFAGLPKLYDLVINISPGSTKSSAASVALVPWCWTRMPTMRSINGSHTHDLVLDLSRKSREIVYSDKYQKCFPEIALRQDQNTKGHWANTMGGARMSCTVAGRSPMGFHGHLHVVDDPIDPKKAISDVEIEQANTWMIETLATRKVEKANCPLILIMQRLAQNDPSGYKLAEAAKGKGGRVRHICLPAEITDDVRPARLRGLYKDGLMDPVRISRKVLDEEAEKSDYYYCTPAFTPILMANWKEKQIGDIEVGDEVVGYVLGDDLPRMKGKSGKDRRRRAKIVPAVVTAISKSKRDVVKIEMESGREIYCTPDHKWWNRKTRYKKVVKPYFDNTPGYSIAEVGKKLCSVYDPLPKKLTERQKKLYNWLGGMIDGDGGKSGKYFTISQSPTANPEVFARIEKVLTELNIPFNIDRRFREGGCFQDGREVQNREECGTFVIQGGRYTKMRLINYCYCAKKPVIIQSIWDSPGFVSEKRDSVVSIEDAGEMEVFGLTTTSGNYVAWGYASQNSGQFLQNPIPLGGGMFQTEMLQIKPVSPNPWHFKKIIRCWDNAGSPRKNKGDRRRAFTVGLKMGLHKDGTWWILDIQRGRFRVDERESLKVKTAKADGTAVTIVQEQEGGSGGQESVDYTIKELAGYHIVVDNPKGEKMLRAEPLSSQVNRSNVFLVKAPWNREFIEEAKHFPNSTYKDQIDAASAAFNYLFKPRRRVGAF